MVIRGLVVFMTRENYDNVKYLDNLIKMKGKEKILTLIFVYPYDNDTNIFFYRLKK